MRSALLAKHGIAAALALASGGVQAQRGRITSGGTAVGTVNGSIGQVGGASGRVGNAGQPLPAPGTRADGGIAGSPTRGGAGPRLQTIIPPSGPARTGLKAMSDPVCPDDRATTTP